MRMSGFIEHIFAPATWLSGRLSFSRKFLLVGLLILAALTTLSVPLWQQSRNDSQLANQERAGLKVLTQQADTLADLVELRSQAVRRGDSKKVLDKNHISAGLGMHIALARDNGLSAQAEQLERAWKQILATQGTCDAQCAFASLTGVINNLLGLTRETARHYRLNVDSQLDATFDMLANRLPLVLETLAKQRDALTINNDEMASYALGAQVVLSESVPAMIAGVSQLMDKYPEAGDLRPRLDSLLSGITQQQDIADKVFADPSGLTELSALASANTELAQRLLNRAASQADHYIELRIGRLLRTQIIIAVVLISTIGAIAYLFAGIYLSTRRSLMTLSKGTDAFCRGELGTRITLDTRDELVLVARNFNTVATEFSRLLDVIREQNESKQRELEHLVRERTAELADKNQQLEAAGLRVQEELNLARNMQLAILPQEFPNEAGWSVSASMFPARELGGDFYDCFALSDGRYGILVADVSGKGVGAAFFMAVSRTLLLDLAMSGDNPASVLSRANDLLCERNPMELFVTACYGIFDPEDGRLVYASAGHHPPLRRTHQGNVAPLPCSCDIALGVIPGMEYCDHAAVLDEGDTLLLYTDGITEALSASGEAYGDDRLAEWLAASGGDEAAALVTSLVANVERFVDGAEASDDLTTLILCRKTRSSSLGHPSC